MNRQINQLRKHFERFIVEDGDVTEIEEVQNDIIMDKVFPWIVRNVISVLGVALIVDIVIMFSVPVETTMSRWFWLKDPLSVCMGFIIVKVLCYLKDCSQSRKL